MNLKILSSEAYAAFMGLRVNRTTPAYYRLRCAGFTVKDLILNDYQEANSFMLTYQVKCICGTLEEFSAAYEAQYFLEHMQRDKLFHHGMYDVAGHFEGFGATSVEHLRKDGFSEEDIKQIRYVYDLEDRIRKLENARGFHAA